MLGFSRCLVGKADSVITFDDVQTAIGNRQYPIIVHVQTCMSADAYWQKPCALILELPMREIGKTLL